MRLRIRLLLATVVLTAAVVAAPAGAGTIPKTNNCGTIATQNGGKAKYIRAYKIGCTTAKAVAGRANGKTFTASRFTCRRSGPTYLCTKAKSKQTIVFTYAKPARRAVAVGVAASAKPTQCGTLKADDGGAVTSLMATHVGCRTARTVARRAHGQKTYRAGGLTCRGVSGLYICTRRGTRQSVVFVYRKAS